MEHFFVVTNPRKDAELKTAHLIRDYLTRQGKGCIVDIGMKSPDKEGYTYNEQVEKDIDCIIVLGEMEHFCRQLQILRKKIFHFWELI